ncbi:MAG: ATP-binding protein [Ferruginibacter sp.]
MKRSYSFFIWIVLVVLGLMTVLVITQLNTSQSVNRLVNGNRQAAATFAINNRLENIVNTSFDIESKLLAERIVPNNTRQNGLQDSIAGLRTKAATLDKVINEAAISTSMDSVLVFLNHQLQLSTAILNSANNTVLIDSLRKLHLSDSIYTHALELQTRLEKTLSATLVENNKVAARVSWLNKLLAFTALIAVLILATIILRRQIMQFILIRDLEQARKLALQSVKVKDQFLANMSHEIRTPLNALKGFSRLLSKTELNDEQREYSNIINNSSESLLHIVNDILDLSKLEAGSLQLKNRPFQLRPLLQTLKATYAASAAEKKLDFIIYVADNVPGMLVADAERLNQVLVNLVSNAIKFTNEGWVRLSIELTGTTSGSNTIKFSVQDTGIGIPFDKQVQIFERFEQLDNAFVRQQGGTGLGLAITKTLVEAMGGNIAVNSEPGKGSTFSFSVAFPLQAQPVKEEGSKQLQNQGMITDPAKKRVLIAEDNKVNQLLVSKLLEPYSLSVKYVSNGHEVISALENEDFDLLLMDVQMPVMDGITATKTIRSRLAKPIPIVGMTAYVQPNEIERCYAAGMNDYVAKPINEEQFFAVLKKYIYLGSLQTLEARVEKRHLDTDFTFLYDLCNGNGPAVKMVLAELDKQLPVDIRSLENALSLHDRSALKSIVHHLKSTLSPLGPERIATGVLAEFSAKLQNSDDPSLELSGSRLLSALNSLVQSVKQELNS